MSLFSQFQLLFPSVMVVVDTIKSQKVRCLPCSSDISQPLSDTKVLKKRIKYRNINNKYIKSKQYYICNSNRNNNIVMILQKDKTNKRSASKRKRKKKWKLQHLSVIISQNRTCSHFFVLLDPRLSDPGDGVQAQLWGASSRTHGFRKVSWTCLHCCKQL